jgi:hypothetical protein
MYPRYFMVPKAAQAYLTFIVESYEGICSLSTVDTPQGIVRISAPAGPTTDLDALVNAMIVETGMEEVRWPA